MRRASTNWPPNAACRCWAERTASSSDRLNDTLGLVATMRRAGLIAPLRPDKYLRIAAAMRRENVSPFRVSPRRRNGARTGPASSTRSAP